MPNRREGSSSGHREPSSRDRAPPSFEVLGHSVPAIGSQLAPPCFGTQYWPGGQSTVAQGFGLGTQPHTVGDASQCVPGGHGSCCRQTQMPLQSTPPLLGSHVSLGSSMQTARGGQDRLPNPPQVKRGLHSPSCATLTPLWAARWFQLASSHWQQCTCHDAARMRPA